MPHPFRFVVSKLGFPLVRYPLTFDDEDLEGIEGWIQCVPVHLQHAGILRCLLHSRTITIFLWMC
jgi:hypothetical protein